MATTPEVVGRARVGRFPRPAAIPSADLGQLRRAARRTRAASALLALALLGSLVAAFMFSRDMDVRQGGFLPVGSTGVIILDLSASVTEAANRRIARVLQNVVKSDEPVGVVLFSDSAYELVPPGTRGLELRPMLRFFTPQRLSHAMRMRMLREGRGGAAASYIENPWSAEFRGGTRISEGLKIARTMLRREGLIDGSVLLVSDLDYSPFDFSAITQELISYRVGQVPLRVIPLFASPTDREFFRRLVARDAIVEWEELKPRIGAQPKHEFSGVLPIGLLVVGVLAAILLAANELLCGRLGLTRGSRA